jgi:hypothetical protein
MVMQGHALHLRPTTKLGRWSLVLAAGFFFFNFLWRVLPGGASLAFVCGIAGGVAGLVAILRRGERGLAVYATFFPLLAVVGFVLAELLIGHD